MDKPKQITVDGMEYNVVPCSHFLFAVPVGSETPCACVPRHYENALDRLKYLLSEREITDAVNAWVNWS